MARKRVNSPGLPEYWVFHHGAFYLKLPLKLREKYHINKQWYRLGKTKAEAHRIYADLGISSGEKKIQTIEDLAHEYKRRIMVAGGDNSPGTIENKERSMIKLLNQKWKDWPVTVLKPHHVNQYFELNRHKGLRTVRADIELLRHMFTMAVMWGVIDRHPFKSEIRLKRSPDRDRYVTDDELAIFRAKCCNEKLSAYVALKKLLGLSKQDMLMMLESDCREEGIVAERRKVRSKQKLYKWDDMGLLKAMIAEIEKAHKNDEKSLYLWHTRNGDPYYFVDENGRRLKKPEAFDSLWERAMKKWVGMGNERFTEHDIRAKAASDVDLELAQQLMDHADPKITERIYRRKPKVIDISSKKPS